MKPTAFQLELIAQAEKENAVFKTALPKLRVVVTEIQDGLKQAHAFPPLSEAINEMELAIDQNKEKIARLKEGKY